MSIGTVSSAAAGAFGVPRQLQSKRNIQFGHSGQPTQANANAGTKPANFPLSPGKLRQAWKSFEKENFEVNLSSPKALTRFAERSIGLYRNSKLKQFLWSYLQPCFYANNGMRSCSAFTLDKIREDGFFKGSLEGAKRIMSCNPLTFKGERFQSLIKKLA